MKRICKNFPFLRAVAFLLVVSALAIGCGSSEEPTPDPEPIIVAPPEVEPIDTSKVDTSATQRPVVPIKTKTQ